MFIFYFKQHQPNSLTKIVSLIKSLIVREILTRCPQVKKKLWGGEFWSDGHFIATKHGNAQTIRDYVRQQGSNTLYQRLHTQQLALFDAPDLIQIPRSLLRAFLIVI
jgi:hypothetical protein